MALTRLTECGPIRAPKPCRSLFFQATGKLKTLYGELISQWTLEKGTFEWLVVVPANTTATVYLPLKDASEITLNGQAVTGSVHEVEAGKYQFVVSG
jgi:alpha-L-rhamnosidase